MPEGGVPVRAGRDIVLIDEARHPRWFTVGEALAEQKGSMAYNVLLVREPDPRWFEENGLALPSQEQLATFAADGIVFLPACHQDRVLSYPTKMFADIAITECLNNAVIHHAGRKVRLYELDGSEAGLAEQRRLATLVLDELDALSIDDFVVRCEAAFLNDPMTGLMHLRFEDLRTNHRAAWLEQMNEVWQQERVKLCRAAAVKYI
jgi:hypothetical protein